MKVTHEIDGQWFEWHGEKAAANWEKHRVTFFEACEVLLDPFVQVIDASDGGEVRGGAIGFSVASCLLFVVHTEAAGDTTRIISARRATRDERNQYEES